MKKQHQFVFLPTDKASDIRRNSEGKLISKISSDFGDYQHLYILSDDKIKSGDIVYNYSSGKVYQMISSSSKTEKKIIATTNPELDLPRTNEFSSAINFVPSISNEPIVLPDGTKLQSDLEHIISLYNGKGLKFVNPKLQERFSKVNPEIKESINKEVGVEKLAFNYAQKFKNGSIEQLSAGTGFSTGYNQCLQDNADKKFTLEDIHTAIIRARIMDVDEKGYDDFKISAEDIIQSLTKEQPMLKQQSDTVMVEYIENYKHSISIYPDVLQPLIKDGCIVIYCNLKRLKH